MALRPRRTAAAPCCFASASWVPASLMPEAPHASLCTMSVQLVLLRDVPGRLSSIPPPHQRLRESLPSAPEPIRLLCRSTWLLRVQRVAAWCPVSAPPPSLRCMDCPAASTANACPLATLPAPHAHNTNDRLPRAWVLHQRPGRAWPFLFPGEPFPTVDNQSASNLSCSRLCATPQYPGVTYQGFNATRDRVHMTPPGGL